jgi:uncharacterized membrane protein
MRGLAVFLMIQGNIAGAIYAHPHPLGIYLYTVFGSFVPALFVIVAGMMVVYTTLYKGYTLKHFLVRAAGLLFVAAIVLDIFIFGIMPFVGMDILYLIAIALPLSYLFLKLPSAWRWASVGTLFLATPVLQSVFGYASEPLSYSVLTGQLLAGEGSIVLHWLIDGWFPIFPWLGFAFLGVNIGLMRWKSRILETFATRRVATTALAMFVVGLAVWLLQSTEVYIRADFGEIIYPPTLGFILTATAQIVLFFALVDWRPNLALYKPFIVFGSSALFMYIAHFALIEYLWPEFDQLWAFWAVSTATLVSLLALGYVLRCMRARFPKRPTFLRLLGL